MSILSALLQSVDVPGDSPHPRYLELLERSLIAGLLVSQVHSCTEQLTTDPRQRAPRGVLDRVVEEIERAPDRGYTVADIA